MYEIISNEFAEDVIKKTDIDGKISWIPMNPENSDYQAYLKSLEENN